MNVAHCSGKCIRKAVSSAMMTHWKERVSRWFESTGVQSFVSPTHPKCLRIHSSTAASKLPANLWKCNESYTNVKWISTLCCTKQYQEQIYNPATLSKNAFLFGLATSIISSITKTCKTIKIRPSIAAMDSNIITVLDGGLQKCNGTAQKNAPSFKRISTLLHQKDYKKLIAPPSWATEKNISPWLGSTGI